jgi:hypothetical protein
LAFSPLSSLLERQRVLPNIGGRGQSHYDPNQPRVPKGNPDGGQWTRDGAHAGDPFVSNEGRTPLSWLLRPWARFAASGRPPTGWIARIALLFRLLEDIWRFREEHRSFDLYGHPDDAGATVAATEIDGAKEIGVNSWHKTYEGIDRREADRKRDVLVRKYPELANKDNVGQVPMNAMYHAEANLLLRAARKYGGTLAGRTLEVATDRKLCPSCRRVLPYLGLELGNPTVTFTDPTGARYRIRDGILERLTRR